MSNSLQGLRILNTRPKEQAKALSQRIRQIDGVSIECPLLEIKGLSEWLCALPDLKEFDKAIFVSVNAVHFFFKELNRRQISWPKEIHVIAIGNASARALKAYDIKNIETPKEPDSEHLLALPSLKKINQENILLVKGVDGRLLIEEGLGHRLAHIKTLLVYQRILPSLNLQWLHSIWRNDAVDIILITSLESLHHLFQLFGLQALPWLQSKPCLVISKRLMQEASLMGIKNTIVSHPERIIETLLEINV